MKILFLLILCVVPVLPEEPPKFYEEKEKYTLIDCTERSVYYEGINFWKFRKFGDCMVKIVPEERWEYPWNQKAKYIVLFEHDSEEKAYKNIRKNLKKDFLDFVVKYEDKYGSVRIDSKYYKKNMQSWWR